MEYRFHMFCTPKGILYIALSGNERVVSNLFWSVCLHDTAAIYPADLAKARHVKLSNWACQKTTY
jgi:hypothetical protein